ncbi:MAG: alpha-ketoacid dehydrogenase subunit beta, partial [Deltaproteobacteria bacterium]|nr:alpha-ketoacid dehydrogenase subunit beta [Deltaproteobacteria bacterium]
MKTTNFRWAINEAIKEEMERDEKVFVAGEDVGKAGGPFGITKGLYEQFGEWRVKDTPLSEEAIIGLAVGAAMAGYRPVVEIMFMDFIAIAMDQICNQAAKSRYLYGGMVSVPMVIRTLCGTGLKAGGHHSQSLESWFIHTPGLKVVFPSTPHDAKGLLKSAIRDDNPVIFMEHKGLLQLKGEIAEGEFTIPLGVADIKRKGQQATVVATGKMVHTSLGAAKKLAEEGIEVEIIDPRTLSPLDTETILTSIRKTHHLIVVHEAPKPCGFGAEVAAVVAEEG